MTWPPDPKHWHEFPAECLWYLFPGAIPHAVFFTAGFFLPPILGWLGCRRLRVSTLLLFQGYLLVAAMIANGLWSCLVWGRFYWSVDYTSDFSVFRPIVRDRIEYSWGPGHSGGLNDITLTELNGIWLAFAVGAWLAALAATWITKRVQRSGFRRAA